MRQPLHLLQRALIAILIGAIQVYRWVFSSVMGPSCRFEPTCSAFAVEAIRSHGPLVGTWLAVHRIARCHPWGGAGLDPVPAPIEKPAAGHGPV